MPRTGPDTETLHRHWAMLRLIPRAPRKIDTGSIERRLALQGIRITRRSIQRDLESLSHHFHDLRRHDTTKPFGWCWEGKTPLLEIPGMDVLSAVTFELLHRHAEYLLPRTTFRALEPYFRRAREVLAQNPEAKMSRWPKKVRVIPNGLAFRPPKVPRLLLDRVYNALLEERRLEVRYRRRGADAPKDYEVSPLGLVLRDGALILVCTFWDYDNINQLLLHRMKRVEIVDKPVNQPRGFNLDAFIAEGHIGFRRGDKPLRLRALIDQRIATGLEESPLSDDQTLAATADPHWLELRATVPDTTALRTWLRGHGSMAEVLKPKRLREEMAADAAALAKRYRGG